MAGSSFGASFEHLAQLLKVVWLRQEAMAGELLGRARDGTMSSGEDHRELGSNRSGLDGQIKITPPLAQKANQGDAVATQDIDDTILSIPVRTNAGSVPLSRQAVERSGNAEQVTIEDLLGIGTAVSGSKSSRPAS